MLLHAFSRFGGVLASSLVSDATGVIGGLPAIFGLLGGYFGLLLKKTQHAGQHKSDLQGFLLFVTVFIALLSAQVSP
jgi:hypothetical protein